MTDDLLIRPTFFGDSIISLANKFFESHDKYEDGPYFVEDGDLYKMEIKLDGANISDTSVNVEDEKYLRVDYFKQTENSTTSYSAKELLPYDADSQSVSADFSNDVLIITVKKKQ